MKKFTIPKPCHQDWEHMLPEIKGKFCDSCQKKVYDFTKSSNQEIQEIFEAENGSICGRFENLQVINFSAFQKRIFYFQQFIQKNFSKFGILMSAISLLMTISGCQKKVDQVGSKELSKGENDSANILKDNNVSGIILGETLMAKEDTAQISEQNVNNSFQSEKMKKISKDTVKVKSENSPKPVLKSQEDDKEYMQRVRHGIIIQSGN